jgi:hypothetical protein
MVGAAMSPCHYRITPFYKTIKNKKPRVGGALHYCVTVELSRSTIVFQFFNKCRIVDRSKGFYLFVFLI